MKFKTVFYPGLDITSVQVLVLGKTILQADKCDNHVIIASQIWVVLQYGMPSVTKTIGLFWARIKPKKNLRSKPTKKGRNAFPGPSTNPKPLFY